ncbi:MAG: hypothetical protein KDD89_16365 [Anaerolineales bacterium]|nr:hypothetical protein [Anaerolineales bacterium]
MNTKLLSEQEIDELVIAEANELEQWEDAITVQPNQPVVMSLPVALAARVEFFAKLHKRSSAEEWLHAIIRERLAFEEMAYSRLKQEMSS